MTPQFLILIGTLAALGSKLCIIARALGEESQRSEAVLCAATAACLILGGLLWWEMGASA